MIQNGGVPSVLQSPKKDLVGEVAVLDESLRAVEVKALMSPERLAHDVVIRCIAVDPVVVNVGINVIENVVDQEEGRPILWCVPCWRKRGTAQVREWAYTGAVPDAAAGSRVPAIHIAWGIHATFCPRRACSDLEGGIQAPCLRQLGGGGALSCWCDNTQHGKPQHATRRDATPCHIKLLLALHFCRGTGALFGNKTEPAGCLLDVCTLEVVNDFRLKKA